MDTQTLLIFAGAVIGPAGAAWAGVKVSLNGTKEDIAEIKTDMRAISKAVSRNTTEIVRLDEKTKTLDRMLDR